MKKTKYIDSSIVKLCSAILQGGDIMPEAYILAIERAESAVGINYSEDETWGKNQLIMAIKLNLINRKQYPFEQLRVKYNIPLDKNAFCREKYNFCMEIAKALKIT